MAEYESTTNNRKTIFKHRLIWMLNKGEIPKNYIIHHINGDKKDNRIDNLECISRSEHKIKHNNN